MNDKTDTLFSKPISSTPFSFDQGVAEVFPDMIKRSVPGYTRIIQNIEKLASRFVTENTNCYDLGCSLGAASLSMSKGIQTLGNKIIAIDNSRAMLNRCQHHIDAFKHSTVIELHHADITEFSIQNASMVVLNFTLQFVPQEHRKSLLQKIYDGLNPGGLLVLSEKVRFADNKVDQLIIDLHHQFKRENGYSDLEISQKRNSLENVLVPDSLPEHIERLKDVNFSHTSCWYQQFNFVSLLAIK